MTKILLLLLLIFSFNLVSCKKKAVDYNKSRILKSNLGNYKGAIEDYSNAIKINPKLAVAYNNRGFAKNILGNYKEAIADYASAIFINPKEFKAYYNRRNAKLDLSDIKGACEDWKKSKDLGIKQAEELIKENCK